MENIKNNIDIQLALQCFSDAHILAIAEDKNSAWIKYINPVQKLIVENYEYVLAATIYYLEDTNPKSAESLCESLMYLGWDYEIGLREKWSRTKIISTFIFLNKDIA